MIRAARTGARRRNPNRRQHIFGPEDVFTGRILARQHEELGGRHEPLARRPDNAERCVERDQRRRRVRRMDNVARPAAEDRMELILSVGRKTGVPAVLEAGKIIPEIPAPRALADIARQRADVPDLRRRDAAGRFRQNAVLLTDDRVLAERVKRDQPADVQPAGCLRHAIETFDGLQVDDHVGCDDALLREPEQVAAASRRTTPPARRGGPVRRVSPRA